MGSPKKFLLGVLIAYVTAAIAVVFVFQTPWHTKEYTAKYGNDHKRFREIAEKPEFKLHAERPALHPPSSPKLAEEIAFVEKYENNPEFKAEQRRMNGFTYWFKVINSATLIGLLVRFCGKPLTGYLDQQIADVRSSLDDAAKARKEAEQALDAAKQRMDQWTLSERQLEKESEEAAKKNVELIQEEFRQAQAQLAKTAEDRKNAEVLRGIRAVKDDVVSEIIRQIEDRHRAEAGARMLDDSVDQFVRLMGKLS